MRLNKAEKRKWGGRSYAGHSYDGHSYAGHSYGGYGRRLGSVTTVGLLLLALVACSTSPPAGAPAATPEPTASQPGAAVPTANPLLAPPATAVPGVTTTEEGLTRLTVEVDVNQDVHPISPLIYGISSGSGEYLAALRPGLNSWGGNPSTRYNWQLGNAWNSGADWFYRNGSYDFDLEAVGESASDNFVRISRSAGAEVRLAVPTLGWVAKDNDLDTCSFPLADGTCSDAGGATCKNPGLIADPTLANVPTDVRWVTGWLEHLRSRQLDDIRFIALDNEPELWGYSHYDVHPTCTTYAEILEKYLEYATAIRPLMPAAELTGPVTCCWHFYWNSAAGALDKARHNHQDFLPWFLTQVRQHDEAAGVRHLDVLDLHYYPEGLYNDNADPPTAARRLRATRSLWDTSYIDESWIQERIALIPVMRQIIERNYPGLKLGLSEWNFGAEETMNGGLAVADSLGIFGREQLDFAAYWLYPPLGSPAFYAFKMYTNFDDDGGRFGGTSVQARAQDHNIVSAFAAVDSGSGDLHLMLINKQPDEPVSLHVRLNNFKPRSSARLYRFDETNPDRIVSSDLDIGGQNFPVLLPPYSITLLVLGREN
jgi:hypothetical protein